MGIGEREIHMHNYRIAYDAMRAYHMSEIEHKKDLVAILNSILVPVVSTYAGILYFITITNLKENPEHENFLYLFIILIGALFCVLIYTLNFKSNSKIDKDNLNYEKYRVECMIEREHLGLDTFIENKNASDKIYWTKYTSMEEAGEKKDRKNSGYSKTKEILNFYTLILTVIIICLTIFSLGATTFKAKKSAVKTHEAKVTNANTEKHIQKVKIKIVE